MTLKCVSTYMAVCDNCGASAGTFTQDAFPGPQYVTVWVVERCKWTAYDTTYHCYRCPPLCSSCGRDDQGCDCATQTGDAAYVSREPKVIDAAAGGAHGQG